jgi:AraC-like DNA-binding protein
MRNLDLPRVPALYLARLLALLERRGVDADALLASAGIAREDAALTLDEMGRFMELAAARLDDPSLGLELGFELKLSSHGMVGFALMTCSSLRDALQLGERILALRSSPWSHQLLVDGATAILRFHDVPPVDTPGRVMLLEAGLGAAIGFAEYAIGPIDDPAFEFWYTGPEAAHHARFRDRLPRTRYGMPQTEARFPASLLERPLALREPLAHREALEALERDRQMRAADLHERVRALVSDPANGFPDLERAARMLHVSTRTLRRRLGERALTFQAIRDDARRTHATMRLAHSDLPSAEIAHELGHADVAAFVRAFRRWTGVTPARFRGAAV